MAEDPKTPRKILEKTIERVESTASALKKLVEDNHSRLLSPHSLSINLVLVQVESIARRLELDAMESRDALGVWEGVICISIFPDTLDMPGKVNPTQCEALTMVCAQVYRFHQLNRAAQLVTALTFSVRGTDATNQTLAIMNSLGALLAVLQILGVICVWSLSSFLMRFLPWN